jgi:hypothetical protein
VDAIARLFLDWRSLSPQQLKHDIGKIRKLAADPARPRPLNEHIQHVTKQIRLKLVDAA